MTLSEKIQIPLFPLGIFLLPGERVKLHIFESRYRQLIADVKESEGVFGIPYTTGRVHHGLGSRCRLVSIVQEYPSGESDVLVECDGLFSLEDFQSMKEDKLYPYGTVRLLREMGQEQVSAQTLQAYTALHDALRGSDFHFHHVASTHTLTVMASLNASEEDKYSFASLATAEDRERVLLQKLRLLKSLVEQERAQENGIYLS